MLGLGFMTMGENSAEVTRALKAKLAEVRKTLPEDVQLEVLYDRTELVDNVIDTVKHNLLAGALLVVAALAHRFGTGGDRGADAGARGHGDAVRLAGA